MDIFNMLILSPIDSPTRLIAANLAWLCFMAKSAGFILWKKPFQ